MAEGFNDMHVRNGQKEEYVFLRIGIFIWRGKREQTCFESESAGKNSIFLFCSPLSAHHYC